MKNLALILAVALVGGCSLYLDLAPLGEDSPDMPLEPDIELDMVEEDMATQEDQAPDTPAQDDMSNDAEVDVDMPSELETLLGEAILAYDFKEFTGEFPSLAPGGDGLRPIGDAFWGLDSVRLSGGSVQALIPGFYQPVLTNDAFSLSLWLRTSSIEQVDPRAPDDRNFNGRIFSLSPDTLTRNFTLAQWRDQLHIRFRDFSATINGLPVDTIQPFFDLRIQHIVVTVSGRELRVFLDAAVVFRRNIDGFNWDPSYALILGNEMQHDSEPEGLHNRPWAGEIYDVRAWDRNLSEKEIIFLFKSEIP